MVRATASKTMNDEPLKHKKLVYPVPNNPELPRCYALSLWIAGRNSGKTWSIAKLIRMYQEAGIRDTTTGENLPQRVIIVSPTYDANPVLHSLGADASDVHEQYSESLLESIIEDIKATKEKALEWQEMIALWKQYVKHPERIGFKEAMFLEQTAPKLSDPPKYTSPPVNHLILDDLVGVAFKATGKSAINYLAIRNRHLQCFVYIATQSLKQIPKVLRNNASLFCVFRYASKKVICDDMYTEVSGHLTEEQFMSLYDFATEPPHSFLYIDWSAPKNQRYKRSFGTFLQPE